MALIVWPHALFAPRSQRWPIVGASVESGRPAIGSAPQRTVFGGGGLVMAYLNGIHLSTREQLLTWKALAARMDNGANPVLVSRCDRRSTPVPVGATVTAATTFSAAFRATGLVFNLVGGRALNSWGGESFSIEHPTVGWRIYDIAEIVSSSPISGGFAYEVSFRPPLREAAPSATPLEFARPRCVMRLAEADGMQDMEPDLMRRADVSVAFVEDLTMIGPLP